MTRILDFNVYLCAFCVFSFLVKYIDVLCFIVDLFRVFQLFGHFMQIFSVFFILFYFSFYLDW